MFKYMSYEAKVRIGIVGPTVLLGTAALTAWGMHMSAQDPIDQFKRQFLRDGTCLAGGPFDFENGATPLPRDLQGAGQISELLVIPAAPNAYTPGVISLVVEQNGFFEHPTLAADDQDTLGLLRGLPDCGDFDAQS